MFCANFAPHETNYDAKVQKRQTINGTTNVSLSVIRNATASMSSKNRSSTLLQYLDNETWHRIRFSEFYKRDYDVFSKIQNLSFVNHLYYQYPPPSTE